jgi:hypothetical protein
LAEELAAGVGRLVPWEAAGEEALELLRLEFWGGVEAQYLHEVAEVGVDRVQGCDLGVQAVQKPCDPRRRGEGLRTVAGCHPSEPSGVAAAVGEHLRLQHSKPRVVVCALQGPLEQQICLHPQREAAR